MAVPTWSVGEVLSANDVNTWFVPATVVKPQDTGRFSTTSMTNDPDLVLALGASGSYMIHGVIFYDGPSAGSSDIQWTFTLPTGAAGKYFCTRQNLTGQFSGAFTFFWTDTVTANTNGVGTNMAVELHGIVGTASAGNMRFLWAQNTSNATNTHVQNNSFLTARRIA